MLSQGEFDAILRSLGEQTTSERSEVVENPRVKPYDFRRPNKFSKENLRTLRMLHETFSRSLGSSLSSHLRTAIQIQLSSVEQMVYDEYIQQLPNPTLINIINLSPLPGRALFEINLDIAFVMLDRLLGGAGHRLSATRELTDIEYQLFRNLVTHMLAAYRDAWSSIVALSPALDNILLNPQFVQATLPGDMALFVLCEIKLLDQSGTISICIPHTVLEPVMDRLSAQSWFISTRRSTEAINHSHADIQKQLNHVALDVAVDLGHATLTFREMMELRAGDVIKLDSGVEDELTVRVKDRPKYLGRPGLVGHSLGVQITRTMPEREEESHAHQTRNSLVS